MTARYATKIDMETEVDTNDMIKYIEIYTER
mgnify:CR=1 FL=1